MNTFSADESRRSVVDRLHTKIPAPFAAGYQKGEPQSAARKLMDTIFTKYFYLCQGKIYEQVTFR